MESSTKFIWLSLRLKTDDLIILHLFCFPIIIAAFKGFFFLQLITLFLIIIERYISNICTRIFKISPRTPVSILLYIAASPIIFSASPISYLLLHIRIPACIIDYLLPRARCHRSEFVILQTVD